MFSIDKNCHSLWDTLPKLDALAAHGHRVSHFVEDIDVAFTALGASVDDTVLHLARERFHRSGGQDYQGHRVRTAAYLRGDEVLFGHQAFRLTADRHMPIQAMRDAGILCLAGKAVLLVTQARIGPAGEPLALPYRGSLYMPAAARLVEKLAASGLLPGKLQPIVRVRFHLLDRLRSLDTVIRLPDHLAACFGEAEVPARRLGESYLALAQEAAKGLAELRDDASRKAWQEKHFPELAGRIAELEARRRAMAESSCTPEQMSAIWKEIKGLQLRLLDETLRKIARDSQVREMDYWDSRGALLPWSIALGGREFYDRLVAEAEIYEEPMPSTLQA
jgi:hypothetical protein